MTARRLAAMGLGCLCIALALASLGNYAGWRERQLYPIRYESPVLLHARAYDLDPRLVLAVMRAESSYRPDAVSSVGAMGLMQIMPDTGAWIAQKLREDGFRHEQLFEPELNIRYGCWYLRYLLNRYDNRLSVALAAYNAGGTNVDRWLSDAQYSDDGQTLKSIPFDQPRVYVGRVQNNLHAYRSIYPNYPKDR